MTGSEALVPERPGAPGGGASGTPAAAGGSTIAGLLATAREQLDRVRAEGLAEEVAAGALVVDIRPEASRRAEGALPGAIVVDRNVLEWRLDPTSPDRIAEARSHDLRVVLVCNEGYASSLAAVTLRHLGLHRATDLAGGYRAWRAHLDSR
jgi:rhodanese-related sulfurtransferase